MTVLEANNKLFEFFSKSDVLTQRTDGKDDISKALLTISEHPEHERAAAICALRDFEKADIVSKLDTPDGTSTFWILKKPFASYQQTVVIDPDLALALADFINQFCESTQDKTDLCDSRSVTTKDIKNLYLIGLHLANKLKDTLSKEE